MTDKKVLILHGWEDDSTKGFIPELVKVLKEKGYSPIALDLPNTEAPKFEEWFNFSEKEISRIGKDNLDIIGHSMGGLLALKLAEKYKINKIILIAPVGSKPSEKYFYGVAKDLTKEELEIYKKYQDREIDAEKIKSNSNEIVFIFGKKDKWVNEEIRNFYTQKFKDMAKINIYDNYGHMSESEGVKKLPELEELFIKQEKSKTAEKETAEKKAKERERPKKYSAVASGFSVPISKKHGEHICKFIKDKSIDEAINNLSLVTRLKKIVPFRGEIPHRKGGIVGRYPVKASSHFIKLLKGLKHNAIVNGLDIENSKIYIASATWASRPAKSDGRHAKRTNIILKAKEFPRGKNG